MNRMKTYSTFMLFVICGCGGTSNNSDLGGNSNPSSFTGYDGFWYMTSIALNGQRLAHVDLSQSIEITSDHITLTDYSGGCAAEQTVFLDADGIAMSTTPSVSCPLGPCTLNYTIKTSSGSSSSSLRCPEDFPVVTPGSATPLDDHHAQFTAEYPSGDEVTLTYMKMTGHSSSACGALETFTTNGPSLAGSTSYLDCIDDEPSQIAFYDDGTTVLYTLEGTYEGFYWRDASNCLLNVVYNVSGILVYFYADDIQVDGDGFISEANFYYSVLGSSSSSSSSLIASSNAATASGYSPTAISCTKVDD